MKVYSMNISSINPYDEKWYKYLSEKRIQKVRRIKSEQKKAQSIGAELLLHHAVRGSTEWDTDENGKLYLIQNPEIYVNLSHSGNYAVCAVNDVPVGIDIQYCRDYDEKFINRFFTAGEAKYIRNSADKRRAFYEIWTRKESLLKAVGKGITVPLNGFSVLDNEIFYEGGVYKFKEYRVREQNYVLSVCFSSSPV